MSEEILNIINKNSISYLKEIAYKHGIKISYKGKEFKIIEIKQILKQNIDKLDIEKINDILNIEFKWLFKKNFIELKKICNQLKIKYSFKDTKNILSDKIRLFVKNNNLTEKDINNISLNNHLEEIDTIKINYHSTILNTHQQIKYVIHLSDLHIRYDRNEEYILIFDKLFHSLKSNTNLTFENTVIVVCGDIFHEKRKQKASALKIWNYFIKLMTSLFNLFVITGNHDYDMESNDMDWLESSFEAKNYYHLNETGEYIFGNIIFGVSALKDYTIFKMKQEDPTKIYIQLFHGTINNSLIDNGQKISSIYTIAHFGKYDYLLLGDIHKHQYLKNNIAYCGSLIQQNRGENIFDHGYIIWNLEDKTSDFIRINNDYCFLKCYINKDNIKFDNNILTTKKIIKVSFFINDKTNQEKLIEEFNNLVKTHNILIKDVVFVKETFNNFKHEDTSLINFNKSIEEYITEYLILNKQEESINKIMNLHTKISDFSNSINKIKHTWILKEISFKNIFCYGGDIENHINLEKDGFYKIFGDNFIGKTSIMNIIKWGLYGGISSNGRNSLNSNIKDFDVLNKDSENGYISCKILILDTEYTIKRTLLRDKKLKDGIRISHLIECNNKDTIIGNENVNNILYKLIGSYKEFELISSINNTDKGLLNEDNKDQLSLFLGGIDMDNFEIWSNSCNNLLKETKTNLNNLTNEIKKFNFSNEELNKYNIELTILQEELNKINLIDVDIIQNNINELKNKLNQLPRINYNNTIDYSPDINILEKIVNKNDNLEKLIEIKKNIMIHNFTDDAIDCSNEIDNLLSKTKNVNYIFLNENINELDKLIKSLYKNLIPCENIENIELKIKNLSENIINLEQQINEGHTKNIIFRKEITELEDNNKKVYCKKIKYENEIKNLKNKIGNLNIEEITDLINKQKINFKERKNEITNKIDKHIQLELDDFNDIKIIFNEIDYSLHLSLHTKLTSYINSYDKYCSIEKQINNKIMNIKKNLDENTNKTEICLNKYSMSNKQLTELESNRNININNEDINKNIKINEMLLKKNRNQLEEYINNISLLNQLKISQEIYVNNLIKKDDNEKNTIILNNISTKITNIIKLNDLQKLQKEYDNYIKNKENDIIYTELNNQLQETYDSYTDTFSKNAKLQKEYDDISYKINEIKNKIKNLNDNESKIKEIKKNIYIEEDNIETYKNYLKLMNYTGIPIMIVNQKLPIIENLINNHLKDYTNFTIKIELFGNGIRKKLDFYQIKSDGSQLSIKSCSGYETLILNIIIKIVLKNTCFLNVSDFLMIDEVLSAISIKNYNLLEKIFQVINNHFKNILIITHIEDIKDIVTNFDNSYDLYIKKNNGNSYIC